MCMYNALKRCGAFVAASVLCFALSVPALADETLVNASMSLSGMSYQPSGSSYKWVAGSQQSVASGASNVDKSSGLFNITSTRVGWNYLYFDPPTTNGMYGLYFSCYYYTSEGALQNHAPTKSDFSLRYRSSSSGSFGSHSVSSVSLFAPSSSQNSLSDGVTISSRFEQSVSNRVTSVSLVNGSYGVSPSWTFDAVTQFSSTWPHLVITSVSLVSTTTSSELDALESMASNIAAQNQILSQFYGDIVAVCNQIYSRLGDLQAAQEEANRLFSNVISLLNTTNGKLEAINMAMSTYFELLINQLKQEGIDTRTAIADAEARLELYLKPMIDYFNELEEQTGESASTLPQHKQDIDGFNNDGFGIEADGQTGLTAILPIFTAFSFILSVLGIFVGLGVLKIIIKKGLS